MSVPLGDSAKRVQDALLALGAETSVVELPQSARTAAAAAQAIGCTVAQIAKSLVFRGVVSECPLLAIASGANRVNERRLSELAAEPVTMAEPDFVRRSTGFAIGGVPPIGHIQRMRIWVDSDLMQFDVVWAAAGTPHAVFRLTPDLLVSITGGTVTTLAG